jgi:hypothetical protein
LWLLEFSSKYNVALNFAECNDFVEETDTWEFWKNFLYTGRWKRWITTLVVLWIQQNTKVGNIDDKKKY